MTRGTIQSSIRRAWHWSLLPLLLLLAACGNGPAPTATAKPANAPTATVSGASVPSQNKIGHVFLQLLAIYQSQGIDGARTFASDQGLLTTQGALRATLVLDSNAPDVVDGAALAVTRIGGTVGQTADDQMQITMPLAALLDYGKRTNRTSFFHDLADFAHVLSIRRTSVGVSGAGGTPTVPGTVRNKVLGGTTEGVALTGADTWHAAGITGKGVKVGVLDGSFTNYKQLVSGNVTTRSFRSDKLIGDAEPDSETIHGTACAEIVREMAPDADLILAAAQTDLEYINAIAWLTTTMKVNVITTSWGWWGGKAGDGTSNVAQAVDRARAAGVFFAVLDGNSASGSFGSGSGMGHFGATFTDKDGDGFHDFPGAKNDNGLLLRVSRDRRVVIFLQWEDWARTHVNYDLYLYDGNGKEVGRGDDDQATMPRAEPVEAIGVTLKEGTYTIKVKKVNPSDPDLPFAINFQSAQLEQVTPTSSLWAPADAEGAISVGAIDAKTDVVEDFSSQGPTADGRKKPDLGSPDDVASYAYASVGSDTFFGTSAATPHVAGAASLYKQAFPNATPDDILAYLTKHVKPPKGSRRGDNVTGAGRLFLDSVPPNASTQPASTPARGTPSATTAGTSVTGTRGAGTPAGTPTGTIFFIDDFTSSASGLPAAGYRGGEYHLIAPPDAKTTVTYPNKSVSGATREVYEVQAHRVNGEDGVLMGLQVHALDANNYVLFVIWADGGYASFVKENGNLQMVGAYNTTPAIKAIGTNTMQLTVDGTFLTFVVNGETLRRIELPDLRPGGGFGMVAGPGLSKAGGDVAFDNYKVTVG